MRPLRPVEPRQAPEVEALRRRWNRAAERYRQNPDERAAAIERAAWRAYRDAAWPTNPGEPSPLTKGTLT